MQKATELLNNDNPVRTVWL